MKPRHLRHNARVTPVRYVALLRGINVGGQKPVKMTDLKAAFESMGFTGVKTVLASGNVSFDAPERYAEDRLASRLEADLTSIFHRPMAVIVRPLQRLRDLVESEPFKSVPLTPETRLYVTFLSRPIKTGTGIGRGRTGTDSQASAARWSIVYVTGEEVLSAIRLSPQWGTTDLMAALEKELGPGITTRNWSTIRKLVER